MVDFPASDLLVYRRVHNYNEPMVIHAARRHLSSAAFNRYSLLLVGIHLLPARFQLNNICVALWNHAEYWDRVLVSEIKCKKNHLNLVVYPFYIRSYTCQLVQDISAKKHIKKPKFWLNSSMPSHPPHSGLNKGLWTMVFPWRKSHKNPSFCVGMVWGTLWVLSMLISSLTFEIVNKKRRHFMLMLQHATFVPCLCQSHSHLAVCPTYFLHVWHGESPPKREYCIDDRCRNLISLSLYERHPFLTSLRMFSSFSLFQNIFFTKKNLKTNI